jgi:acyl-coenzyme A synthetase/AMP-(fatty) acid ligase
MLPLLDLLNSTPVAEAGTSLGDAIATSIDNAHHIETLLDCLGSSARPALYSSNTERPPLLHDDLRVFVQHFALPYSEGRQMGPNDRVMLLLETGPENALALLSIATYYTCAPVNVNCTAAELQDDAMHLNAKCIVTTKDTHARLKLGQLRAEIGCDIVFIVPRSHGPAGLFDMELLGDRPLIQRSSDLHGLSDFSLVLHTSGTSGKKKIVRYTLRSLIIGTCCVIASWALRPTDVNCELIF